MKLEQVVIAEDSKALTVSHGTKRISRSDIPATIKHVSELTGIPKTALHVLGSGGKIEDSGDLDLAVDINQFHPEHLDRVMKSHGLEGYYDKGRRVASYAVPIAGDKGKGLVQVDLMFTPNTEWAKFSYFSAGSGSRYKGAVRTVLLTAVAAIMNEPGTDHIEYLPNGEMLVRAGRTIDLPSGLKRIYQYRPKKVAGDGYLKNMKSVSPEDFAKMFPDVTVKGGNLLIDNPEKVVKALFGKGVAPEHVESAEQVIHLIKKTFNPQDQKKIFRIAAKRLGHLKGKIRLPDELEQVEQK